MEQVERKWNIEGHETVTKRFVYKVTGRTRQEAEDKIAAGEYGSKELIAGYEQREDEADGDTSNYEVEVDGEFVDYVGSEVETEDERLSHCEQTVRQCEYGYDKCDQQTRNIYCKTGCNNKCDNFAYPDKGEHTHKCGDDASDVCADCGIALCRRHTYPCYIDGVKRCAFCAAKHRTEVHGGYGLRPNDQKYWGGETPK